MLMATQLLFYANAVHRFLGFHKDIYVKTGTDYGFAHTASSLSR